jgi:hypothetical protein
MMGLLGNFGHKVTSWLGSQRPKATSIRPQPDARQSPRFASQAQVLCESAAAPGQQFTARVVDVSEGGIRLDSTHACEPGSLLHLRLPQSGTRLLACVLHAMPAAEEHSLLGCSFIRELSNEELQQFISQQGNG